MHAISPVAVVLPSDDVRVIWDAFARHVEDKPGAKHILHLLDAALQKKGMCSFFVQQIGFSRF
jgi:hypothetical protein